jgi:putative transposase
MKYRRDVTKGGMYFFTVVTYKRRHLFNSRNNVELLREAFRYVLREHIFRVDACVILPDHLHTVWTLPDEDFDYSTRWRLIKSYFSHNYLSQSISNIPESRKHKGEQVIWQRRFGNISSEMTMITGSISITSITTR